jgi:glycosyl transferase family 87
VTTLQREHAGEVRQALAWVRAAGRIDLPEVSLGRLWGSLARPLIVVLYGLAGGVALTAWATFSAMVGKPVDAWCYYRLTPGAPYWQTDYAFVYSPAAAQAMIPFQALPFEVFVGLVRAAELAAAFALAGPFLPLVILWPPLASEINAANINLLIVAVAVWGLRWPALWSLVLLTKVTPGVGLLWFAVRGEWRNLAIAFGLTGAIVLASFVYAPGLWFEWPAYMATLTPSDGVPLWARVGIAAALVAWGARTNRPWTVVLAVTIATPRLHFMTPAMLIGLLYYIRPQRAWLARPAAFATSVVQPR